MLAISILLGPIGLIGPSGAILLAYGLAKVADRAGKVHGWSVGAVPFMVSEFPEFEVDGSHVV